MAPTRSAEGAHPRRRGWSPAAPRCESRSAEPATCLRRYYYRVDNNQSCGSCRQSMTIRAPVGAWGILAGLGALAGCGHDPHSGTPAEEKVLNVYNWADYIG